MPELDLSDVREIRARRPEAILEAARSRVSRPLLGDDGRLVLIAADHPARGSLAVGDRPQAMADRQDLLHRLVVALGRPGVDGVLGTADILDDLLLLGALDGKVVIASTNRGGLQGASFELDDRFTACDAAAVSEMGYHGGKMLCRIDPDDAATVRTLEACAHAVTDFAGRGLVAMIEPFMSTRRSGRLTNDLTPDAVIRSIGIASALGATSRHTWMKLPVVDDLDRVMRATTMPTLLLGGDPVGSADDRYAAWEKALAVPGVRGLVVGRALLYPPDDDVASAVDIASALTHGG